MSDFQQLQIEVPIPIELNIVPIAGGSTVKEGVLKSPNYATGQTGWVLKADGTMEFNEGTFRGALVANSIDIPDTTTANSFHVDSDGNIWLGATTFAAAPGKISNAGIATLAGAIIDGAITTGTGSSIDGQYLTAASVASASANLAMRGWTYSGAFSASDADTVAWASGTFTASDGTAYSITGANTGNSGKKITALNLARV